MNVSIKQKSLFSGSKTLDSEIDDSEFAATCPNTLSLFPESFRKPLQNMVDGICPNRFPRQRLAANEFSMTNINHLKLIKDMGINIIAMGDGRVQLLHSFSSVSIRYISFVFDFMKILYPQLFHFCATCGRFLFLRI